MSFAKYIHLCNLYHNQDKEYFWRRSQDGRTAWKFFVCLVSMKYSQTITKPSCPSRKVIWGLTQQSAQSEPQNSAGLWCGEVNLGREKLQRAGSHFWVQREDGDRGRAGENMEKGPLPKSSWRESWKLETATGTKLKSEKGERRKEGLNSIKAVNKGSTKSSNPQLNTWWCSVGKVNPQEQGWVQEVLGPHGEKRFHRWKGIW